MSPASVIRHVSRERAPGDRGRALGVAVRDAVDATVALYERMFALDMDLTHGEVRDLGRQVGEALARRRPQSLDEICGIAQGAGHPDELLLAANARREILAGGTVAGAPRPAHLPSECSAIGIVGEPGEGGVLAQTWDFHPDVLAARLLWIAAPPSGRAWATLTEAGLLAKTGLNADGLALTVNFITDLHDGGLDGVPAHVLLRWLLEDCATVDEAEAVLGGTPRNCSLCVTVAARRPGARERIAAFELVPDDYAVLAPSDRGHIAHTNHFLTPVSSLATAARADVIANSTSRLGQLWRALDRGEGSGFDDVLDVLSDDSDPHHPVFVRADADVPWLERCGTLATVAYDVGRRAMWLRAELEPSAPFERVALPWD